MGYAWELHYRRLTKAEQVLVPALRSNNGPANFRDVYHQFLLGQLFVGTYDAIDGGSHFAIDGSRTVIGHEQWKSFDFHDYFGTLHPYADDTDALSFSDADGHEVLFNWRFSGDTLKLIELKGNGDSYWLGKKQCSFLKR